LNYLKKSLSPVYYDPEKLPRPMQLAVKARNDIIMLHLLNAGDDIKGVFTDSNMLFSSIDDLNNPNTYSTANILLVRDLIPDEQDPGGRTMLFNIFSVLGKACSRSSGFNKVHLTYPDLLRDIVKRLLDQGASIHSKID